MTRPFRERAGPAGRSLMLIGDLLVHLGLITPEQLQSSLELQSQHGGRLGRVIASAGFCPQSHIDRAWADAFVLPALQAEVKRLLDEAECARVKIIHLSRRSMVQEDMLTGCERVEIPLGIEGIAELSLGGAASMPFQFVYLAGSQSACLDPESAQAIRGWADRPESRADVSRRAA